MSVRYLKAHMYVLLLLLSRSLPSLDSGLTYNCTMALSRTPLAPDPGYEKTCNFYPRGGSLDPTPRGRVRPEAMEIARLHTVGSVSLLFHPEDTVPQQRKYRRELVMISYTALRGLTSTG